MPTIQKFELSAKAISSLALTCALLLALIGASYAWFADMSKPTQEVGFEATAISSYFAGGDGTKDNPYIITTSKHMYYLAWLQNKKVFQTTTTYFKLDADIDMKGQLTGIDTTSGAIPPIGTDSIPFIGHFDGAGHVISNLWISTAPNDWKEHPDIAELKFDGNCVGLFGEIGEGGIVTNFVLDRVEVTSNISGQSPATVGIVCGYVGAGAHVSKVGVYNGKISCSGANIESNYSLIGAYDEENLSWIDKPGANGSGGDSEGGTDEDQEGGDITIIPNFMINGEIVYNDIMEEKAVPVAGAATNSAYFVGIIDKSNNAATGYKDMTNASGRFDPDGDELLKDPTSSKYKVYNYIISNDKQTFLMGKSQGANNKVDMRVPGGIAIGTAITDIRRKESGKYVYDIPAEGKVTVHDNLQIPTYGVWFKPKQAGTASIAFSVTNNSGTKAMAIYSCVRDEQNNLISLVEEQTFALNSNKTIFYYEYEVEANVEYVIGASTTTTNDTVSLVALVLGGSSDSDGPVTDDTTETPVPGPGDGTIVPKMENIDYIPSATTNFNWDNHKQSEVLLSFSGTNITGSIIYRAALETVDSAEVQKVYYYNRLGEGVAVSDLIGKNLSGESNSGFDERVVVKS